MSHVAVLGGLNMDLMLETPVPAGTGETREGTRFYTTPGGKGGNQAVAAARILAEGGSVSFIGRVGTDAYGEEVVASLERFGVDTTFVRRDPAAVSGVAVIFIDGQGESYVNAVYGANARCNDDQLRDLAELLPDCSALLVQQEIPREVTLAAMRAARAQGVTVILDPAPTREAPPDGLVQACDIITPNEHEAADLCGFAVDDMDAVRRAARQLREAGVPAAIITLGARGAWLECDGASGLVAAPAVRTLATVGAGDAFNGFLAAGLASGRDLNECVRLAVVAGALSVTKEGAQDSMPTLDEVLALAENAAS